MNKNTQSPNTARAADEKAEMKSKAQELLDKCHEREARRVADPNCTAEIIRLDDKTEIIKWRRTDELNDKIF